MPLRLRLALPLDLALRTPAPASVSLSVSLSISSSRSTPWNPTTRSTYLDPTIISFDDPTQHHRMSNDLRRELGPVSATLLGLGSILGTGVFVSLGLAAGVAGSWLLPAIAVAAAVATCNALSSAQLAAAYPRSGGTYEYGYELLHPLAGFTAGWMFLSAKSASAAAAALGFAAYASSLFDDSSMAAWLAPVAVVALTALVAGGLRRTNLANAIVVFVTVAALLAFTGAGAPQAFDRSLIDLSPEQRPPLASFLEACALCFVAYTGYGRVATLGEEVKDPRRTIPVAIIATLVVSALLYLSVAAVAVGAVGDAAFHAATQSSSAPLEVVARDFALPGLVPIIALGAVTAMIGVLLNLLLGLSRVLLAMGRRHDMPHFVTKVHAERSTPYAAVVTIGVIVLIMALTASVAHAWSFSAFTVLVYYSLTNLAALRLAPEHRLYPRWISVVGLIGCAGLAFFVERNIWLFGLGVLAVGWVWFAAARALAARRDK